MWFTLERLTREKERALREIYSPCLIGITRHIICSDFIINIAHDRELDDSNIRSIEVFRALFYLNSLGLSRSNDSSIPASINRKERRSYAKGELQYK